MSCPTLIVACDVHAQLATSFAIFAEVNDQEAMPRLMTLLACAVLACAHNLCSVMKCKSSSVLFSKHDACS